MLIAIKNTVLVQCVFPLSKYNELSGTLFNMARSQKQSTKYLRKRKCVVGRRKRVSPTKKRKSTVKRHRRQQKVGLSKMDLARFFHYRVLPLAEQFVEKFSDKKRN